ncbi:ABC transporter ATP-binding protein, partial [Streptomyces sp. SID9944]|nr:ABC transporter ATP-binding protein [Streptomyces sp. SID9944]
PRVVFADEPTGALDSLAGEQVMAALVHAARASGTSVLVVTHDAQVAAYADREVRLRDGATAGLEVGA